MDCVWRNDRNLYNYVLSRQVPHMIFKDKPVPYQIIITDPHEILLFSLCIKSTIVVFKMTKQLSKENGGGPFLSAGKLSGVI